MLFNTNADAVFGGCRITYVSADRRRSRQIQITVQSFSLPLDAAMPKQAILQAVEKEVWDAWEKYRKNVFP